MRNILTFLAAMMMTTTLAAQGKYMTSVEVRPNEKWWGVFVGGTTEQPLMKPCEASAPLSGGKLLSVSVMVSNSGRYIWSKYPMEVSCNGNKITIVSDFEKVEAGKGGRSLREAYLTCCHKHMKPQSPTVDADLFVRPVYDMGISGEADQDSVLRFADNVLRNDMPTGTILLNEGWQSTSHLCSFSADMFPDPAQMVRELHSKGFRIMLGVSPRIAPAGKLYYEARRDGILLASPDGKALLTESPAGYSACIDITRPGVAEQYAERIAALKNLGVDGFIFNYSDAANLLDGDKERMQRYTECWNSLGSAENKTAIAPAGNVPPSSCVNWMNGGSEYLTWENLPRTLNSAIASGLAGYIYSHFTTGECQSGSVGDGLLLRAAQLSLFMPLATLSPAMENITDPTYKAVLKKNVELRRSMSGYISSLVAESANTAEPLVRHLEYQFPGQGFANCTDQFMLGPKYLIAPVLDESPDRTVRLPKGVWIADDGTKYRGPRILNLDVTDGRIPVFTLQ